MLALLSEEVEPTRLAQRSGEGVRGEEVVMTPSLAEQLEGWSCHQLQWGNGEAVCGQLWRKPGIHSGTLCVKHLYSERIFHLLPKWF